MHRRSVRVGTEHLRSEVRIIEIEGIALAFQHIGTEVNAGVERRVVGEGEFSAGDPVHSIETHSHARNVQTLLAICPDQIFRWHIPSENNTLGLLRISIGHSKIVDEFRDVFRQRDHSMDRISGAWQIPFS